MKPTHPARRFRRHERPAHPSQIRDDVKEALAQVKAHQDAEDAALEAAVLAAHREVRLASSIPALCEAAMRCQGVTAREAFVAVAVATGFHESHVQRLFYRQRTLLGTSSLLLRGKKEEQ